MTSIPDAPRPGTDVVELTIPASSAWIVLARTAATATGARIDLPVERLDDLALAVDEAAALLLGAATAGASITCAYRTTTDSVEVELSTPSQQGVPATDSFAWLVLTSLADRVDARSEDGRLALQLTLRAGGGRS